MEDQDIIRLYLARDHQATRETQAKYGPLLQAAAARVLNDPQDREECVNDALLALWNTIPPQRPRSLAAYLTAITRNQALKRWEKLSAQKRNPAAVCSLSELEDCVSGSQTLEDAVEADRLAAVLSDFVRQLSPDKRWIFLARYLEFHDIPAICQATGYSKSKVSTMLHRLRRQLREYLQKEDFAL